MVFTKAAKRSNPPRIIFSINGFIANATGAKAFGTSYEKLISTKHEEGPLGKNRTLPLFL
jgi:hypothetical protein